MSAPCLTSPIKFQLRRDTSTNWSSVNPVLYAGEPGIETNTGQMKVGDGIHTWNQLPYVGSGGTTGPTGAAGSGSNIASSYGYSQSLTISNGSTSFFKYDSTYIETGTYLAANLSGDLTRVVVTQPGIYEIITSIQLQSQGQTTNVFTWLVLNGSPVADTNGGQAALSNVGDTALVSLVSVPYMIFMNAGDYIEIAAKTGSANVSAIAFAADSQQGGGVAAPSIAINIKKIATDIGKTGPTGPVSSVTGPTGVIGPTGAYAPIPSSMLGYFTNDPQSLPAGTDTLVRFNQLDTRNSVGTTGMTLAAIGNYVFTNTTANSIPLLIDWYLAFNGYTGATVVYTYAGVYINGATPPTYRQGEMYSQFSIGSAAFVASTAIINVAAGESIGIYANSSSTANIVSGQSYVTLVPLTGFNGATGPQGVIGPTGFQGVRGPIGFQGVTGPQGFQGVTGVQGFTGFQGVQGPQGVQGFTGFQGVQGPQGVQGFTGFQGVQGPQGVQGFTGFQGVQGPQGVQGFTGFQGVQGPQGVQGFTGFQGVQGPQGVQGFQGVTGPTGILGPTGIASLVPTGSYVLPTGYIGYMKTMNNFALPTTQLGNVARVDQVYGNDSTAYIGGLPFATVPAAISAVIGTGSVATPQYSNTAIWVLPGVYNISPTGTNGTITDSKGATIYPLLQLPATTALRGISLQTCTIQCSNPSQNTALFYIEANTRMEDLTMTLGSSSYAGSNNLVGLYFDSTATVTSKIRTTVLNLCNASMPYTSSNNLYGVQFDGTGGSFTTFSFNCYKGSTINVYGNGSGSKRGIIVTNSNIATLRDTNVYVAAPPTNAAFTGSYVGIETADANNVGSIQLRSTTIGSVQPTGSQTYTASDILQTNPTTIASPTYLASPGIQVGPGVDLVTKTAGGKGFSSYVYPTQLFYGVIGTLGGGGGGNLYGWLWPGSVVNNTAYPDQTRNANNNPAAYRVQQPMILAGIQVNVAVAGTGTLSVTAYKNATANANGTYLSSTGSVGTSLSNTLNGANYNGSINFAAGDLLSVYVNVTNNNWQDVSVQLDCF